MKKCSYCGALYDNEGQRCPKCSSPEYRYQCVSCGEEFNANFCPKCGTNINDVMKTCPTCGRKSASPFCPNCGTPMNTGIPARQTPAPMPYQAPNPPYPPQPLPSVQQVPPMQPAVYKPPKNKWAALLLCFFFGMLGAHKFYEGNGGLGVLYLFTMGLFGIGWLADLMILATRPNPYYV